MQLSGCARSTPRMSSRSIPGALRHQIMQQRVAAVRFPPPARTPEQAVQRAQVAGDARRQGFRLLPGVVKAAVQYLLQQLNTRHGRIEPQCPAPLPLRIAQHYAHPAGVLHKLQGVLQAIQVVLRQQVSAARTPQVFQLAGQVRAHALFAPLLQQPAHVARKLFAKTPLLLSHGQPPRQEQAFLGGRDDGTVLLRQLQGDQPAPGQVTR